jgi:5-methylcytosine-specific restriction enzyme subunit McrC
MLAYDPRYNPRRVVAPTPRPDFVIQEGDAIVAVLDAKYRDLWERPLPREMLYQLALYALSQESGCRSAAILYPTLDGTASEARIEIREPVLGSGRGSVRLRPVLLTRLARELTAAPGPVRERALADLARELAFGS